jgi:hypothetical protein
MSSVNVRRVFREIAYHALYIRMPAYASDSVVSKALSRDWPGVGCRFHAMLALTLHGITVLDFAGEVSSFFLGRLCQIVGNSSIQDKGVQHDGGCLLSASAIGVQHGERIRAAQRW